MSCNNSSTSPEVGQSSILKEEGDIFIVDRTGKKWDVTHAKEKYGMEPERFQFGLGPLAIKPILNPTMLSPSDLNYPNNNSNILVLGTTLNGEARAYPISVLAWHEIADEVFGDVHVAVAY